MNEKSNVHSRLLEKAAREILSPLGLRQKGRSRIWLDDRVWWIGIVEFQPSEFSKGSYLNVGCMWLWHIHSHIAYSRIDRIEEFQRYESEAQFGPVAESLAHQAKDAIERYRKEFKDIKAVRESYLRMPKRTFWQAYDAGVACGLCGDSARAVKSFEELMPDDPKVPEWQKAAIQDARYLTSFLGGPLSFKDVIVSRIKQARQIQKLPPPEGIDF
jgi:hypothetical protein